MLILVGFYAGIIAYLELTYLNLAESNNLKNVGQMHSVLGFVISLLLVFRTNTAYDRWWEGRKIWGTLTNSSRNLAMKLQACVADPTDRQYFKRLIPRFARALKCHLRENEEYVEEDDLTAKAAGQHVPNRIAAALYARLHHMHSSGSLSTAQLLLLNEELRTFTEVTGACERIKNTPIPFTYSVFIKKFIFFYVMTLPFGWVFSMGYYVVPVVVLILYAFASLELIAEEIENPFGTDDNDLPLDTICENIQLHVTELLP